MNKIKQRIYEFGRICNGMTITHNTHIENTDNAKTIPIMFKDKIIGQCTISTDDYGIICDGIIYNDISVNNIQIGMFFINEHHYKDDVNILDDIFIANVTK